MVFASSSSGVFVCMNCSWSPLEDLEAYQGGGLSRRDCAREMEGSAGIGWRSV
jgi:hypothetical protein